MDFPGIGNPFGIFAIIGNVTTLVVIFQNHLMRENPTCLFLATLFCEECKCSWLLWQYSLQNRDFFRLTSWLWHNKQFLLCTIDWYLYNDFYLFYFMLFIYFNDSSYCLFICYYLHSSSKQSIVLFSFYLIHLEW